TPHQIIDFNTRLPLLQAATPGARADIVWGEHLIRGVTASGKVRALLADKAYEGSGSFPPKVVPEQAHRE
ncbi:MAG: hypothetical protein AAB591_01445, partial [Patescibacteria group bacterium]